MIDSFKNTGRLDLMHWSQPAFLGAAFEAVALKCFGLNYWWCGILSSSIVLASLYSIARRFTNPIQALLVALTVACYPDFIQTIPTIMSDQVFLGYFALSLFFAALAFDSLSPIAVAGTCLFFFLASITRAHGFLIPVALAVTAIRFKSKTAGILSAGTLVLAPIALGACGALSINKIPLNEITVLPKIFTEHQFALFDLRATVRGCFQVCLTLLPLSFLHFERSKVRLLDYGVLLVAIVIAANFALKGIPIVYESSKCNLLSLAFGPVAAFLLSNALREPSKSRELPIVGLLIAFGTIAVMPISPHPLLRHALPAAFALCIVLASKKTKENTKRTVVSFAAAIILIVINFCLSFHSRSSNDHVWVEAQRLVEGGAKPEKIFAGWSWYCKHNLIPGREAGHDYQVDYSHLKEAAPVRVTPAPD